jgi:asparaginyl-tRNA synthetase
MEGSTSSASVDVAALRAEIDSLRAENASLRQQLGPRPVAHRADSLYGRAVSVRELSEAGAARVGQRATLCGWVRTCRLQGRAEAPFAFVHLYDGSSAADFQLVVDGAIADLKELHTGAALAVTGEVVASAGKGQATEMRVERVEAVGACDPATYPISKKDHSLEFLRSVAHFRPRTKMLAAVLRVRSAMAIATHEFFSRQGFAYVHTPIITAADCEGAGELFGVTTLLGAAGAAGGRLPVDAAGAVDFAGDFFGRRAYLTVSGQLAAEIYASALGNVYTFGPTFRAEDSNTTRHVAEFWMIEPEMAYAELADNINVAEAYLKYCVQCALDRCAADLELLEKQPSKTARGLVARLREVVAQPFARMTYREAVGKVLASGKKFERKLDPDDPKYMDMGSEHERYLTENITKRVTVVTDYPKEIKAFYMRLNDDGRTVAAMDILVPGIGELMGGSQREERADVLLSRLDELGLDRAAYDWYLDLRRYGSVKHSGFGLGFERLLMFVCGVENIRDVIGFPRYPGHAQY